MSLASSTLTTMPIAEPGFYFHVKSDFHDHIRLRYCWPLDNLSVSCPCGARFNVGHAQVCKLSGFIHVRHNDPTDFIATCMKEIHHDVELEVLLYSHSPANNSISGLPTQTLHGARADLRVKGFWTDSRNAFFYTRVFYPHAPSYRARSLPSLYRRFEGEKKREYGERINEVEHGSFTPLVFLSCGGMGPEAAVVIKKLTTKRRVAYSKVVSWLRCCLSFSLARSAIRCIRGSRSVRHQPFVLAPVDLVQAEARLIRDCSCTCSDWQLLFCSLVLLCFNFNFSLVYLSGYNYYTRWGRAIISIKFPAFAIGSL